MSRPRRRQFQPKANIPMGKETYQRLLLELHTSCAALAAAPSPDSFNRLSKMFAALCRAGMVGQAMDVATSTMSGICDRFEIEGLVTVKESEAARLYVAIEAIETRLHQLPVNRFMQAVAEVELHCAGLTSDEAPK